MITIKRPTKIVELCVDLGLAAEHDRAEKELIDAQKRGIGMENSGVPEAAEAVEDIEKRMQSSTLEFVLQAIPRKQFGEFEANHPPRVGDKTDENLGVNVSELDGLIAQCVLSVREKVSGNVVEFDPADWTTLADDMTDGQWQAFALAALQVNRGVTAAPFSRAALLAIQRSEKN